MNKLLITVSLFFISTVPQAQYYYKDIVSTKQLTEDMANYKAKKVRNIKLSSFEDNGEPSQGFFCEKRISKDFKTAEVFTRSNISSTSLFTSIFNDKGQIIRSADSSEIAHSRNLYSYDGSGRLKKIESYVKSSDDDFVNEITEEHIYEYDEQNLPVNMRRVKNRKDTTLILFSLDQNKNVGIEKDTRNGSKYYYYYDSSNRLTDVVNTNEYRKNLVAIYIFEYNTDGTISQMTTTEEGGKDFFVWRYDYENELRRRESIYSQNGKILGSIEYQYK